MIYLLRHGQIATSPERRFVGQRDLPLTEHGRAQARWWAGELAGQRWVAVVASDLGRCREFAALAAPDHDSTPEPALREICLGQWEGLTRAEVEERLPGQWEARGRDIAGYRPPGGESFAELQARAMPVLRRLAKLAGDVLVVAHSGVNRALVCGLLGLPLAMVLRLGQDYACLNLIAAGDGGLELVRLNQPCGLPE